MNLFKMSNTIKLVFICLRLVSVSVWLQLVLALVVITDFTAHSCIWRPSRRDIYHSRSTNTTRINVHTLYISSPPSTATRLYCCLLFTQHIPVLEVLLQVVLFFFIRYTLVTLFFIIMIKL